MNGAPLQYTHRLMRNTKILISAGEASSDLYAAELVEAIRERLPGARFFGCAGPKMRRAGVHPVIKAESLAVVGLAEVLTHIPRIYGEYRKLLEAARRELPSVAVLTDSPDFHLRIARKLHGLGIPVVYLVAPQVWAWRKGRIRALRRDVDRLLAIFPFEERFFTEHGVPATYIGHPMVKLIRPELSREEFFHKHGLSPEKRTIVLLPGSRAGEAGRHLPALLEAVKILGRDRPTNFLLAAPAGMGATAWRNFREPISLSPIQVIEGETWDAIAHADFALAASGTVTVEAALLGTPMVTFYKVTGVSWWLGRFLVDVPFYSMVNLIAGRQVVPEVMQEEMTGERLAREALRILHDPEKMREMKRELREVGDKLAAVGDPMKKAAGVVQDLIIEVESDAS